MKTRHLLTIFCALLALLLSSCGTKHKQYVIGVSQCSEDSWRSKLHNELDMATYFNEGVTLRYASANDDVGLQERQINEMIDAGVDLLIVSPQQMGDLTATIDRAYDKGIPVILFDRKTNSDKYTAFMGADNYDIGYMLANHVAEQLGGKGCIVEIGGLKDSSPAIDRTKGFRDALKNYPELQIVAYECGNWKEESGQRAMEDILARYDGPIDCIFGGNDRMAVGARRALERHGRKAPPVVVGIDALPGDGQGICQVRDGILTASAIYPTHGDELMALAINILEGHTFERETPLASSIVTGANAKVLLLQNEEVVRQGNYLRKMHTRIDNTLHTLGAQRLVIGSLVMLFLVCGLGVVFIVRAYRQKQRLAHELQGKNVLLGEQRDEMQKQAELLREQRDTLQEQHDQLCEQRDQLEAQRDELALQRDEMQKLAQLAPTITEQMDETGKTGLEDNHFYQQFMKLIYHNVGNSEFSVEQLADALGLSRAQMYRRCKQITGNSPVEILRIQRMQKAGQLLSTSGQNISEVTYACGFTSPSYFTKCFREHYGMSPTDFIRHQHSNKHNP